MSAPQNPIDLFIKLLPRGFLFTEDVVAGDEGDEGDEAGVGDRGGEVAALGHGDFEFCFDEVAEELDEAGGGRRTAGFR